MQHLLRHEETHIEAWYWSLVKFRKHSSQLTNWFNVHRYDSLSVVLCCRIITAYQSGLVQQNITCLQPFYEQLLGCFWPRFNEIIKLNAARY